MKRRAAEAAEINPSAPLRFPYPLQETPKQWHLRSFPDYSWERPRSSNHCPSRDIPSAVDIRGA
jgi:hypothetical protein